MWNEPNGGDPSILNRLLEEISWEGSRVKQYRRGGLGLENVLTAEVLMPLDFLPRPQFLGSVIEAAHGADAARAVLAREIEHATLQLLPDQLTIRPAAGVDGAAQVVQPDALIIGTEVYALVEAKRVRSASFGPEQLARELVVLSQECGARLPLLLLILGAPPPIRVQGAGLLHLAQAVERGIEAVLERTGADRRSAERMTGRTSEVVAWISWEEIKGVVLEQERVHFGDESITAATVHRLVRSLTDAIDRHSSADAQSPVTR